MKNEFATKVEDAMNYLEYMVGADDLNVLLKPFPRHEVAMNFLAITASSTSARMAALTFFGVLMNHISNELNDALYSLLAKTPPFMAKGSDMVH